ncbi:hypothetical protein Hanom_Chr01g00024281 [Helianthus anomalus]
MYIFCRELYHLYICREPPLTTTSLSLSPTHPHNLHPSPPYATTLYHLHQVTLTVPKRSTGNNPSDISQLPSRRVFRQSSTQSTCCHHISLAGT